MPWKRSRPGLSTLPRWADRATRACCVLRAACCVLRAGIGGSSSPLSHILHFAFTCKAPPNSPEIDHPASALSLRFARVRAQVGDPPPPSHSPSLFLFSLCEERMRGSKFSDPKRTCIRNHVCLLACVRTKGPSSAVEMPLRVYCMHEHGD
jgi:hypothetical protein